MRVFAYGINDVGKAGPRSARDYHVVAPDGRRDSGDGHEPLLSAAARDERRRPDRCRGHGAGHGPHGDAVRHEPTARPIPAFIEWRSCRFLKPSTPMATA